MTAEFDRDIAVIAAEAGGYRGEYPPGWVVGGGVNGGFQLALLGNAIRTDDPSAPDPITLSAYFASPGAAGPVDVDITERKRTRRFRTVAADLVQTGDVRISSLATFGDLSQMTGEVRTTAPELDLPPRENCVSLMDAPPELRKGAPELMHRFEMRFHPEQIGFALGEPTGVGELSCWFRLNDGREPDPLSLLLALDAMPPVTFNLLGERAWAPTLELTAHIRALPAPGWLKVRHATRNFAGGMFEEDCEIWDSAGRLVAQSRQLALAPK